MVKLIVQCLIGLIWCWWWNSKRVIFQLNCNVWFDFVFVDFERAGLGRCERQYDGCFLFIDDSWCPCLIGCQENEMNLIKWNEQRVYRVRNEVFARLDVESATTVASKKGLRCVRNEKSSWIKSYKRYAHTLLAIRCVAWFVFHRKIILLTMRIDRNRKYRCLVIKANPEAKIYENNERNKTNIFLIFIYK